MDSSDGFRRRKAIDINFKAKQKVIYEKPELSSQETDHLQTWNSFEHPLPQKTHQNISSENKIKFNRINEVNHAILKNRKKQQNFQKIIDNIQPRGSTFYRIGFKSYEKKGAKKIFSNVLNLGAKQMKGTMHIGELLSNIEVTKFMKENHIYENKLKLMDKLFALKKSQDVSTPSESMIEINSYKSFTTCFQQSNNRHPISERCIKSINKSNATKDLEEISEQLKTLKKQTGRKALSRTMRSLQSYQDHIAKVERKYFLKMIDLS